MSQGQSGDDGEPGPNWMNCPPAGMVGLRDGSAKVMWFQPVFGMGMLAPIQNRPQSSLVFPGVPLSDTRIRHSGNAPIVKSVWNTLTSTEKPATPCAA